MANSANSDGGAGDLGLGVGTIPGAAGPRTVRRTIVHEAAFHKLCRYWADGAPHAGTVLFVPPLAGHFPDLFRDLVEGLLQHRHVLVAEWRNARDVPVENGDFGFKDCVGDITSMIEAMGPGGQIVGLCQSVVPVLVAVSDIAARQPELAPEAMVLIAGPVDPLANPTRVVQLLRERQLEWFVENVLRFVGPSEAGSGRLVYPADVQLTGLLAYMTRHLTEGRELSDMVSNTDDGFWFLRCFTSLMDLPASLFLDNIDIVYHRCLIARGQMSLEGRRITPSSIDRTALLTIEGGVDDIAAPGQTVAAHALCDALPDDMKRHCEIANAGHFSLFHGPHCRDEVVPAIDWFLAEFAGR